MAPGALQDLCRAIELFERTAKQSGRAKIALGVLYRLKEKAIRAFKQHKSNIPLKPPISPANNILSTNNVDDGDDDLAIFGGQTRVVSKKSRHKRAALSSSAPTDSPSPPGDNSSGSSSGTVE
ncbi:hypothetical protein H0H93_004442, partial [Arthromyces matolae]